VTLARSRPAALEAPSTVAFVLVVVIDAVVVIAAAHSLRAGGAAGVPFLQLLDVAAAGLRVASLALSLALAVFAGTQMDVFRTALAIGSITTWDVALHAHLQVAVVALHGVALRAVAVASRALELLLFALSLTQYTTIRTDQTK
jgi:hypothetical protein